ncbi:hypothetical protein DFQ28_010728 [Apophysomyces sp. BC1034]|nr:hypothetical protein DFQ30_010482 [Apophysomyces sp. BC1015]KAG0191867.1 hypothetical protein DFQ28_010728 [Apophysomyces sp. BC1034]
MNKQISVKIPVQFDSRGKDLLPFVRSCWEILNMMLDTLQALHNLRRSRQDAEREHRYKPFPTERKLSNIAVPVIVKITEKEHAVTVGHDGPASSPIRPEEDDSE